MKRPILILGILVLALTLGGIGGLVWLVGAETALGAATQTKVFRIPSGEPLNQTAQRLFDEGLIRNPLVFRVVFQWGHGEGSFPSGTFSVPGGMTALGAADFFRHAQPIQIRVTVPEGWTSSKIARLLEEKNVVSAKEFLDVVHHPDELGSLGAGLTTLDGRLFPETYLFPLETPAVDVARTFLQTFQKRTLAWSTRFSPEAWENKIILASIVEREYRTP